MSEDTLSDQAVRYKERDEGREVEFKLGDEVWYVPRGYALGIRCKIRYVDEQWRKQGPGGILFYDLDEPIGHSITEDEICLSREEAEDCISDWFEDDDGSSWSEGWTPQQSLEDYRRSRLTAIMKSWDRVGAEHKPVEELMKDYPAKEKGNDWFNLDIVHENSDS